MGNQLEIINFFMPLIGGVFLPFPALFSSKNIFYYTMHP
jgi:hypothetical protein